MCSQMTIIVFIVVNSSALFVCYVCSHSGTSVTMHGSLKQHQKRFSPAKGENFHAAIIKNLSLSLSLSYIADTSCSTTRKFWNTADDMDESRHCLFIFNSHIWLIY